MNPLKPTPMTLDEAKSQSILMIRTFYKQVDPTNGPSLEVHGGDALERYQFNYFLLLKYYRHYLYSKEVVESMQPCYLVEHCLASIAVA